MPRKPFSGLTTIEDVKGRCRIDDLTGCWHWTGAMVEYPDGSKSPRMWVYDTQRKMFRVMSGPLAVLELEGTREPWMTMGWRGCRCGDCANPNHIIGGTKKQWGAWVRLNKHWKHSPRRTAANRRANRERSEIDITIAREVRESTLNNRQAAAAFGLTETHVSQIRMHRIWKETVVPGASVFTLGAR